MNRQEVLRLVEEILTLSPQTLTGNEELRDLAGWDSLSTLRFIAVVDRQLGLPLRGRQVAGCKTVEQLLELVRIAATERAA